MTVNQSYEDFVMHTVNTQYFPRTLSEAFKDADYGTALWKCEKPHHMRNDAIVESLVLMFMCGLVGYFVAIYLR